MIGVLAIVIGVPLMAIVYHGCRDFFAGRRLPRGSVPAAATRSSPTGSEGGNSRGVDLTWGTGGRQSATVLQDAVWASN